MPIVAMDHYTIIVGLSYQRHCDQQTKLTTLGPHKQNVHGFNNNKGANIGARFGSKSLESEKYELCHKWKEENMLSEEEKGGKQKRQRTEMNSVPLNTGI